MAYLSSEAGPLIRQLSINDTAGAAMPRDRSESVSRLSDGVMSPVKEPKEEKPEKELVPLWKSLATMGSNVLLTVSIVIINKALFSRFKFGFAPTLLLTLHQFTCAVGTQLTSAAQGRTPLTPKTGSRNGGSNGVNRFIALIVLTRIGGNVLVNLSLKHNTVGMYQLFKMLQVPFVFIGELFVLDAPFRMDVAVSLVILVAGLTVATVNDLSFSLIGTICGCVAPLAAAVNSIALKQIQTRFDITGNELLKQIAPWVVAIQMLIIPITDDLTKLPDWLQSTSWLAIGLVFLSCIIAWGLEWSLVMVLNYTSAMSLQVLGHVKTMLIILSGVALFRNPLSLKSAYGMLIAFGAVVLYSYLKTRDPVTSSWDSSDRKSKSPTMYHRLPILVFVAAAGFVVLWSHLPLAGVTSSSSNRLGTDIAEAQRQYNRQHPSSISSLEGSS